MPRIMEVKNSLNIESEIEIRPINQRDSVDSVSSLQSDNNVRASNGQQANRDPVVIRVSQLKLFKSLNKILMILNVIFVLLRKEKFQLRNFMTCIKMVRP